MISKELQKARDYESAAYVRLKNLERPRYHFSCPVGWLNDPNGFSYYNDKYHLFYQYHPYDSKWGPMHWGHAVSTDLLHWTNIPCALAPDTDADRAGCFSGSAIELPNGKQLLLYTGVQFDKTRGQYKQAQSIAIGDGINYEKLSSNPVATIDMTGRGPHAIEGGASQYDFRDPKIFLGEDGFYYFVAVNCAESGEKALGRVLLFKSADAIKWDFERVLLENDGTYGKMWECPDYFKLGRHDIILLSPMDMEAVDGVFNSGNSVLAFIGHRDDDGKFLTESVQCVDNGIDFYATQTTTTVDGRLIMTAWMQNWDTTASNTYIAGRPWIGQMILPRELSFNEQGRLIQTPVCEISAIQKNPVFIDGYSVKKDFPKLNLKGRYIDLTIKILNDKFDRFEVRFFENSKYHTSLIYRRLEKTLTLDRRLSGTRRAIINEAHCAIDTSGEVTFRLLLDAFSVECFCNGGEKVMTALVDTPLGADGVSFLSDGDAIISIEKYDLE